MESSNFVVSLQVSRGPRWGLLLGVTGIFVLLLSVIQPEFLLLTVIYEITVTCHNTF